MTMRPLLPALLLLLLLLAGCQTQPLHPQGGSDLQRWLEQELVPYLARQLSSHPRFRGEPVALVAMQGDEIQPDIDELSDALRRQLQDALLEQPGVTLPWEPATAGLSHHRRRARPDCRAGSRARYYIGLQFTPLADGSHRLSVRLLDPGQGEWVAGFGRHWQGRLSGREQRALSRRHPDETLRGLRPLPFAGDQLDRAAEYLANNLGCLLQQRGEERLRVQLAPVPDGPPLLGTIRALLDNNLSRFGQLAVTDDPGRADLLLRLEAQPVAPGLYQVWTGLVRRRDGDHLNGLDTPVYVRATGAGMAKVTERAGAPRIETLALTPDPAGWCAGDACYQARIRTRGEGELFLLAHTAGNGVVRLTPGCQLQRGPAEDGGRGYRMRGLALQPAGHSTLYAILVQGDAARSRLRRHLEQLPAGCEGGTGGGLDGPALDRWLTGLDRLLAGEGARLQWQARRTP
ncbi:MAG TPA: hypothetical protein ENI96_15105 [Sedimenticola thiotaurini]|uniref:Uncharacterized protein n=1 Tax=Sedimenticola thiotaurini TaxID=1543721 RepID=A0A831RS28_9GAMM|nr:hypothetical protein [Sedimenticola thiotaurini]